MKKQNIQSYIINTLLFIPLCGAYCLIDGLLGAAVGLLIGALLGVVFYKHHYFFGILNSALGCVIFTLFCGFLDGIMLLIPLVLVGITLAIGTRLKCSLYTLLLACTVLYLADFLISMFMLSYATDGVQTLSSVLFSTGKEMVSVLSAENIDAALLEAMQEAIYSAIDMSITLSPAIYTIVSIMFAYAGICVYKAVQRKNKEDMSFLTSFSGLQSDLFLGIIYVLLFIFLQFFPEGLYYDAALNVFVIVSALYVFLGISVIDFKLRQKGMRPLIRFLLLIALFMFSGFLFMVPIVIFLIIGVLDSFMDYRHLRQEESKI